MKGTESALIFGSGFQANSSILAALVDGPLKAAGPIHVFSDRLCHASFHFGLAAGKMRQFRYRHNDLPHLEQLLLKKTTGDSAALIVTESVFSMEGDCLDVDAIREIARRHGALLYVDEAHATGILGANGMGLMSPIRDASLPAGLPAETQSRHQEVVIGTFGKALGCFGAYVACSRAIRDYLVNRCAGLIYSTALPPMVLGAIDAALDLVPEMQSKRQHVQELSAHLRSKLQQAGFDTLQSSTHIVPVVVADDSRVLQLSQQLLDAGFLVGAIRPPHGSCRHGPVANFTVGRPFGKSGGRLAAGPAVPHGRGGPMKMILVHGWALGPWIWHGLVQRLCALMEDSDLTIERVDLGFFGDTGPPAAGHYDLAIGHSFGLLWLLQDRQLTCDRIISINGFTRFSADTDFPCGWPQRVLQRMRKQLAIDRQVVLADFANKAGIEDEFRQQQASAVPDVARLDWALEALINRDGREQWDQFPGPRRAIAATKDEIVTAEHTNQCFADSDIQWLKSGCHCLPLKFPEICAALVRELIEVT